MNTDVRRGKFEPSASIAHAAICARGGRVTGIPIATSFKLVFDTHLARHSPYYTLHQLDVSS